MLRPLCCKGRMTLLLCVLREFVLIIFNLLQLVYFSLKEDSFDQLNSANAAAKHRKDRFVKNFPDVAASDELLECEYHITWATPLPHPHKRQHFLPVQSSKVSHYAVMYTVSHYTVSQYHIIIHSNAINISGQGSGIGCGGGVHRHSLVKSFRRAKSHDPFQPE